MKQYDLSTALWDKVYSECELIDLSDVTLHVEPTFDACLKVFAEHTSHVLDFGCGTSDILFQCADYGHLTYGMGIDRSETGIVYSKKMANLNHYRNLDFVNGDLSYITQMDDECFNGIILSNILDVVPADLEKQILSEMTRLLPHGGLLFVKLNPYVSKEDIKAYGWTDLGDDLYEDDGILRVRNLPTSYWKDEFSADYKTIRYIEFPYPWQEGMNRLFLLQRQKAED